MNCELMLTYDTHALRQTGSRNLTGQKTLPTIWGTYITYMHIFRHIFLSNYWWQESDIWSQASYRYAILWEAFFGPVRFLPPVCRLSWFLYTLNIYAHFWYTYMTLVTKYQIFAINSYLKKMWRKISWTDRGNTVYPLTLRGAGV
jgi:hypothetical protein